MKGSIAFTNHEVGESEAVEANLSSQLDKIKDELEVLWEIILIT